MWSMRATKSASCWMTERRLSKSHSMGDDELRESTKQEPMAFFSELKLTLLRSTSERPFRTE